MSKRVLALLAMTGVAFAAELPVRQVILYKHGVGYFERAGELGAGESARLDFKASEMNDVLKSLTINDSSGKVIAVRYDSSEPLARRLAEYPFALGEKQSLAAFLDQLKGARIELKFGPETVAGVIVGARVVVAGERQPEREQLVVLADSGDLRTLDLSAAQSVKLTDAKLQTQLKDYLAAMAGARGTERRGVYIDSTEDGARRLSAGYMIPTPVWKSSYRLLAGEKESTLEGWAVIDNTTGDDWSKIRLSLVSGRPISFISRLYEPRYRQRPEAELPEDRAVGPVVHEGGVAGSLAPPALQMAAPAPLPASRPAGMGGARRMMVGGNVEADAMRVTESTVAATAEGRELGELFEYRFAQPVTVRKGESAMLPFLQQKIAARKLLIHSDPSTQNPMNAAELTNSSGKTLDGGPITVYDGGAYAGEALMETLKAGDKRLISYAVDLGTRVTTALDSTRDAIREIHFRRGILTTRSAIQETKTYTIRNVDQKPKTLVLEHPVRPGFKLLNQKPAETTAGAYRFEVRLAGAATEKFPLIEERVYDSSVMVANLGPDVLLSYVQNKALSETARKQLDGIAELKRRIGEADADARRLQTEIAELTKDQERLRENIASLNRVSGQQEQVQKYARDLAAQESRLAGLRDQLSEARKRKAARESELNSLIEKVEF
ncbi:MAG: hypothetical protein Q8N47_08930 [Bryobacterales bacterium]|nr:hypothetical protein [Bryobacterales bacterium]